jgi:transposase
MNYIGLDVHKKTISYCVKDVSGRIQQEGKVGATRRELDCWMKTLPQPWTVAMEATIFSGWIYDHLLPQAAQIKVAHPLMLRAIAAAKKKNDQIDASQLADCLRCDFLPECHMMPRAIGDRRRTLRYRHLLVRQMVQMKNRVSGLLMETGVEYNKQRLHKVSYFRELLSANGEVPPSLRPLLKLSRETIERCQAMRMPLSKQRNKHIQRALVEAAKLAPRQNHKMAVIYDQERQKGNSNRATLAVARKMVAYLLAVDRQQRDFVPAEERRTTAA